MVNHRIVENCENLRDLEVENMTETNVVKQISRTEYVLPIPEMQQNATVTQKSASFRIQRRRQRLIALYNTAKRFSVGRATESLSVSRWTVERDLNFLREHDLLSPKRSQTAPFEVLESGAEFCSRFNKAHKT